MSNQINLKAKLQPAIAWASRFDELSIRERLLVSVGVLSLLWCLWYFFVYPMLTESEALKNRQLAALTLELNTQKQRTGELKKQIQQDPNLIVKRELAREEQQLAALKSSLQSTLSQFIKPSSMTLVLRDLMTDHDGLKLNLLNRLPARKLIADDESNNLYLHPMKLEFEGEYLEVLSYLNSVESGDWQFNWKSFDYKTKGYPNGVAEIEIETLSRNKYWLGL